MILGTIHDVGREGAMRRFDRVTGFILVMLALAGTAAADVLPEPPIRPWVQSITPSIGRPAGGEMIRLSGSNFESPVRIFFDVGAEQLIETFVVSLSDTRIEAITPNVLLPAGAQQLEARVMLITKAGTAYENSVEAGPFTFRNELLTPRILTATPNTCPIIGGTRVSIFGEGFQAPVQVLIGDVEARVLNVQFNEIVVETPPHEVGIVAIRVNNITSNTSFTRPDALRYRPNISIDSIGPLSGPEAGGTRVSISGRGFNAPVAVLFGDEHATVIRVSGTQILALTPPVKTTDCQSLTLPLRVVDIVTGEEADGPSFTFIPLRAVIVGLQPAVVRNGDSIKVTLDGHVEVPVEFYVHGTRVVPSAFLSGTGTTTYVLPIPRIAFPPSECGTRVTPVSVDVRAVLQNGCEDLLSRAVLVLSGEGGCRTTPPDGH